MQLSRRSALKKGGLAFLALNAAPAFLQSTCAQTENKSLPIREIYCPGHFGNSYEAMWPREMQAYLTELKWWGFNRYSDWITTTDIRNPYASDAVWDLGREQLERKKKNFRAAQDLGLHLNLILTPNHVYLDQLRPELAATKNKKIFGQLLCPSQPEARKIILHNAEQWFRDLADSGIVLSAFTAFAYDYGGCGCKKCHPWILTFARLMREVHSVAQRYHPKIEPWFCSWWWTPEEHDALNQWAAKDAPGWLKGMTLHIEYEQTRMKEVAVPQGCRKIAFIHNGYADTKTKGDIYSKFGPVIAPQRIPLTLQHIAQQGAEGFQAYSEGVFDDANKAILGSISSGKFSNTQNILEEYAKRYFAAPSSQAQSWAAWLAGWGDRTKLNLAETEKEFQTLAQGVTSAWRLEQWRCKLRLEKLDREIGRPKENEWSPAKLNLADQFWAEQEHLQRDVYKLGPVRHVFAQKFSPPGWYDSWQRATHAAPRQATIRPEA